MCEYRKCSFCGGVEPEDEFLEVECARCHETIGEMCTSCAWDAEDEDANGFCDCELD
jgi:hypothetical protein